MSGPLPAFLAPVTVPVSWVYGLAVRTRNARYERGEGVQTVGVPVISVGNVTVGGSGKTPMVAWIGRRLGESGHRPVIAMRGYRARPGEPGDEQQEHEAALPGIDVLANPDRVSALRAYLPDHPNVDCVLLDDGFQHRRLARDLDLVLIDATRDTMRDRLLPAGSLREPLESLARADAVIVTRAPEVRPDLAAAVKRWHGRPPLAWARHSWTGLDRLRPDGPPERLHVDWLDGRRVVTLLGVGNPEAVVTQVEAAGAVVAARVPARDHERYERPKLDVARGLCGGADALIMTAKDWINARARLDLPSWPVPVVVPRLELEVFEGAEELESLVLGAAGRRPSPTGAPSAHV